jgi:hypothetical protein
MPDTTDEGGGRIKVIEAIKTPLNAIVLFALIAEAFLITGSIQSDRIPYWAPLLVMVLIIVLFFVTILFRPSSLYHEKDKGPTTPIDVQLGFPVDKQPIDLDTDATVMTVRPWKGGQAKKKDASIRDVNGSWVLQLPPETDTMDLIQVVLTERNGRQWRVDNFSLIDRTVTPKLTKDKPGGGQ